MSMLPFFDATCSAVRRVRTSTQSILVTGTPDGGLLNRTLYPLVLPCSAPHVLEISRNFGNSKISEISEISEIPEIPKIPEIPEIPEIPKIPEFENSRKFGNFNAYTLQSFELLGTRTGARLGTRAVTCTAENEPFTVR